MSNIASFNVAQYGSVTIPRTTLLNMDLFNEVQAVGSQTFVKYGTGTVPVSVIIDETFADVKTKIAAKTVAAGAPLYVLTGRGTIFNQEVVFDSAYFVNAVGNTNPTQSLLQYLNNETGTVENYVIGGDLSYILAQIDNSLGTYATIAYVDAQDAILQAQINEITGPTDVTYAEAQALVTGSDLVPNTLYRITNATAANGGTGSITVLAVSTSSFQKIGNWDRPAIEVGFGFLTLSGTAVAPDEIQEINYDGVNQLSAAVPFDTDYATTCVDIAANINANGAASVTAIATLETLILKQKVAAAGPFVLSGLGDNTVFANVDIENGVSHGTIQTFLVQYDFESNYIEQVWLTDGSNLSGGPGSFSRVTNWRFADTNWQMTRSEVLELVNAQNIYAIIFSITGSHITADFGVAANNYFALSELSIGGSVITSCLFGNVIDPAGTASISLSVMLHYNESSVTRTAGFNLNNVYVSNGDGVSATSSSGNTIANLGDIAVTKTFAPTNGTAVDAAYQDNRVLNQTGTATGYTYSFQDNSTLTGSHGHFSFYAKNWMRYSAAFVATSIDLSVAFPAAAIQVNHFDVDATGGARTITLPTITDDNLGMEFSAKKVDVSGNAVTLSSSGGQNIEHGSGNTTEAITTQYNLVRVRAMSDSGTFYWTIMSTSN